MTDNDNVINEVRLMTEHYAERISDYFADQGITKEEYLAEVIANITDYFECECAAKE